MNECEMRVQERLEQLEKRLAEAENRILEMRLELNRVPAAMRKPVKVSDAQHVRMILEVMRRLEEDGEHRIPLTRNGFGALVGDINQLLEEEITPHQTGRVIRRELGMDVRRTRLGYLVIWREGELAEIEGRLGVGR